MRAAETLPRGRGSLTGAHRGRRQPCSCMLYVSWSYHLSGLPGVHLEGGRGLSQQAEAWDTLRCVILPIENKRRSLRHLSGQGEKVIDLASTRVAMGTRKLLCQDLRISVDIRTGEASPISNKLH